MKANPELNSLPGMTLPSDITQIKSILSLVSIKSDNFGNQFCATILFTNINRDTHTINVIFKRNVYTFCESLDTYQDISSSVPIVKASLVLVKPDCFKYELPSSYIEVLNQSYFKLILTNHLLYFITRTESESIIYTI